MRTHVKLFATPGTDYLLDDVTATVAGAMVSDPDFDVSRGEVSVAKFSNENIEVQVDNVRDHTVVVLHTQAPPVSDNLVTLFALLDAINNAHPRNLFVVFPYMPYSRSDRKNRPRISVMGQRFPEILNKVLGVRRVLLIEPHAPHIKQYFAPTADEVPAFPVLMRQVVERFLSGEDANDFVAVFADAGAAKRFENIPYALGLSQAFVHKVRLDHSESPTVRGITGEVRGKHCLLLDDEILTGGTVLRDAAMLKQMGAATVRMVCAHGILADQKCSTADLMRRLADSEVDEFIMTDTVPVEEKIALEPEKFTLVPIAPLLGEAIKRMVLGESLSELHTLE